MSEIEDLEKRLIKIEASLIEQEHRPIKVITNYLFRRKKWSKNDERVIASKKAIIWRLFFSPGVIAASGGVIAVFSLFILSFQLGEMRNQNKLIFDQNNFFRKQILNAEITSDKDVIYGQSGSFEKANAVKNYIRNYRLANNNDTLTVNLNGAYLNHCDFSNEPKLFKNIDFTGATLGNVNFTGTDLSNSIFIEADFHYKEVGMATTLFTKTNLTNCTFSKNDFSFLVFDSVNFTNTIFNWQNLNSAKNCIIYKPKNLDKYNLDKIIKRGAITTERELNEYYEIRNELWGIGDDDLDSTKLATLSFESKIEHFKSSRSPLIDYNEYYSDY